MLAGTGSMWSLRVQNVGFVILGTWGADGRARGYVETMHELPRYVELIELDEPTEATFTRFYATSLTRDGSDAIRPFA
jgi:hypothetical protein